jgi:hypothetical protein
MEKFTIIKVILLVSFLEVKTGDVPCGRNAIDGIYQAGNFTTITVGAV